VAAVFVCIVTIAWLSRLVAGETDTAFIVASMGAAVVLVFSAPESRLSQPWPLLGGHFFSASCGVTCHFLINDPVLAVALAVAGAMALMYLTRTVHPPGGAIALAAALGGESVERLGYWFVLFPVMFNTVIMLGFAYVVHRYLLRNPYPVRAR
jgi:CBS-domain-containing membrane protein